MDGYNQLLKALMEKYEITVLEARILLNRCLFDYDVIVSVLDRAEELQNERII